MKEFVLSTLVSLVFIGAGLLIIALSYRANYWRQIKFSIRRFFVRCYAAIPFKAEAGRFLFLSFFVITIIILKKVDVSWQDYEKFGFLTVSYWGARLVLSVYLMMICFGAGSFLLKSFYRGFRLEKLGAANYVILGFFLGASAYGIILTAAGFAGILNLPVALLLTVPALWSAFPPICTTLSMLYRQIEFGTKLQILPSTNLICLLGVIGVLFFSKGLYPGSISNDVWEHYLPYYREVKNSGSIWPNEIWSHFFLSKGAGLFFLVGLLSDSFAAQLVSSGFIAMSGLIVFRLLKHSLHDSRWAILGATIFFAIYDGDFFKHHSVITGYIAFLIWSAVQMSQQDATRVKIIWSVVAISSFYLTFYIPPIAFLLTIFWGILGAVSFMTQVIRCPPRYFITIGLFTALGACTALIVNYEITGLAEMIPIRLFWQFADREKFDSVFGASGILFFMYEQAGIHTSILDNLEKISRWIGTILRLGRLKFIIILTIGYLAIPVATYLLSTNNNIRSLQLRRHAHLFIVLASFILPTITISLFVQVSSTYRLFAFTTIVTSIILVICIKLILEAIRKLPLPNWYEIIFLTGLSVLALTQALQTAGPGRFPAVVKYAYGSMSFADVLKETDDNFNRSVNLGTFEKIRRKIGPEAQIMTFGYDPAPGYSFPGRGVMSEPSYTLGPNYLNLVFGEPEQAKTLLQSANINFFFIPLRSRFFTGLAFSKLFKAENLNNYFELVSQDGDTYLLTWRASGNVSFLPEELIQIMDLKQTGILFYPSSSDFYMRVKEFVEQKLILVNSDTKKAFVTKNSEWLKVSLPAKIQKMLLQEIENTDFLPKTRVLLKGLVTDVILNLGMAMPKLISTAWAKADSMRDNNNSFKIALNGSITENISDRLKTLFLKEGGARLGAPLIKILATQDERIPFGITYQSAENVQRILEKSLIIK
jgi:hypothetical protein